MALELPTQDYLLRHLSYDPASGDLRWRMSKQGRQLGRSAGCLDRITGYRRVRIDGRHYWAHRVIWKMMTGQEPKDLIDHKNNDATDNRWDNIREANHAENCRNCKKPATNKSGVKGVCWDRGVRKWRATITVNDRTIYVGIFHNLSDAARARQLAAEQAYGAFARGG